MVTLAGVSGGDYPPPAFVNCETRDAAIDDLVLPMYGESWCRVLSALPALPPSCPAARFQQGQLPACPADSRIYRAWQCRFIPRD